MKYVPATEHILYSWSLGDLRVLGDLGVLRDLGILRGLVVLGDVLWDLEVLGPTRSNRQLVMNKYRTALSHLVSTMYFFAEIRDRRRTLKYKYNVLIVTEDHCFCVRLFSFCIMFGNCTTNLRFYYFLFLFCCYTFHPITTVSCYCSFFSLNKHLNPREILVFISSPSSICFSLHVVM